MQVFRSLLPIALMLAGMTPSSAQDVQEPDLSLGAPTAAEPLTEETAQAGQPYIAESHGDWQIRCVQAEGDAQDPCQLYQLLTDQNGGSVAEISLFPLPEGQQAEAGATLITPLETLLTEQVTISIDGGSARRYPFSFCTQQGCVSRIGLTGDDLAAFRRGSVARMRIVPVIAPDQEVVVGISLSGFTAGFAALVDRISTSELGLPHTFRSARTALRPPNANALDRATFTLASRASFGTTSSAHSGSGSS